jgi:UDP-N-acetylmuramate dehydrogenase
LPNADDKVGVGGAGRPLNPQFRNAPAIQTVDRTRLAALTASLQDAEVEGLAENAELGRLSSWQIGGAADLLLQPATVEALAQALAAAHEAGVKVTLLGGGTNILISDAGIRGLVVRLGKAFDYRRWHVGDRDGVGDREAVVEVGSASRFIRLAKECVEQGYGGLEFAAGIPGSVGGAVRMNAGAFGGEVADTFESLVAVTATGEILHLDRSDLEFSYRRLALAADTVISSSCFRLQRSSRGRLQETVSRVQEKRRRHQPAGLPNAGSVFKNPPDEFAGRLIEQAGLKGRQLGQAQVSEDHANFIVNLAGATARDVHDLMCIVQDEVWSGSGVWLEPEVQLIGDWV